MMVTGYLPVSGGLAHLAKAAGCVGGVGLQPQTELGAGVRPNVRQCRSDGADPAAAKDLHFYKVRIRAVGKLVVVPWCCGPTCASAAATARTPQPQRTFTSTRCVTGLLGSLLWSRPGSATAGFG
jgi:hypothetical protein